MQINIPEIKAELQTAFDEYERALTTNDIEVLDELFYNNPLTIRYGIAENLYGYAEIAAFRAMRPSDRLERSLERTQITTYGRDAGVAMTLFRRVPGKIGRQSQTWMRTANGWRIVAAHVSLIDE
jgi:hypothetical protein